MKQLISNRLVTADSAAMICRAPSCPATFIACQTHQHGLLRVCIVRCLQDIAGVARCYWNCFSSSNTCEADIMERNVSHRGVRLDFLVCDVGGNLPMALPVPGLLCVSITSVKLCCCNIMHALQSLQSHLVLPLTRLRIHI
jgi:hypothetical protein